MQHKPEVKNPTDLMPKASDFVVAHGKDEKFLDHYFMEAQVLGEGSFGEVRKCKKLGTYEERAVKIIKKDKMSETQKVRLKYEVDILKNLNHPNIVRLYEVFEDNKTIHLVTELCDGRELFEEIQSRKNFSELEAAIVTKQILQAISYCHDQKVAHRDLKPENILIDAKQKGIIKLIDFGTSHSFDRN